MVCDAHAAVFLELRKDRSTEESFHPAAIKAEHLKPQGGW